MIKKINFSETGFTLIEVLIALVIFSVGILGVGAMQISSIQGNETASNFTEALIVAQDKVADLHMLVSDPANWVSPVPGDLDSTTGLKSVTVKKNNKIYTIKWLIIPRPSPNGTGKDAKEVTLDVIWQPGAKSIQLSSLLLQP